MEHSLLHAIQLCGAVVALGGALLMLVFLFPALNQVNNRQSPPSLAAQLNASVTRWVFWGAAFSALAAVLNILVDVSEIDARTLGGVNLGKAWHFVLVTAVGHISVVRVLVLVLIAVVVRFTGQWKWWLVALGAVAAAVCESLISHTAALPSGRVWAILVELIHILAASVWLGVLIHLLLARRFIESATDTENISLVAGTVRRFSPVAMSAVGLLGISGLITATYFLWTFTSVVTSAYGLTLLVKLTFLLPLLYAGYVNYTYIRPGLQAAQASGTRESRGALLRRFGRALELEVTAGVLLITVAGILASVSPPAGLDALRLTPSQINALTSVHLPQTQILNPETFVGAEERTLADLRYSEFTHNWSGIMVFLLGFCWLVESLGGRTGRWAERIWPLLLIPFPIFIAVAADPEVWWLRKMTFFQVIQDPQILEHQLGALLAFTLVGLGWLDRRLPAEKRPLGYALPGVMILGSLLLLGHAHSTLTTTQELSNLINVQHAIFGAFGLFAGTIRWLDLRGLVYKKFARIAWPGLVIGLGLFMTFCYRETL